MTKRIQKLHAKYAYENGEPVPFKKPKKRVDKTRYLELYLYRPSLLHRT